MLLLIVVGFLPRLIGSPLLAQSSYNIWFFEGNSYWSNGFSLRKLLTLYYTNIYILKKSNINRQQTSRMICHEIVWCVDEMKKTVQKIKKKIKMKLQLFFFSNLCRYLLMLAELMVVRHLHRVVSSMNSNNFNRTYLIVVYFLNHKIKIILFIWL